MNSDGQSSIQFKFEVLGGPHQGQSFVFSKSEITAGRGAENDLVLVEDPKISRRHFKVIVSATEARIENLSQKNQLFVNANSIQNEKLINESLIQVGDSVLKFTAQFAAAVISEPYVPVNPNPQPMPVRPHAPPTFPSQPHGQPHNSVPPRVQPQAMPMQNYGPRDLQTLPPKAVQGLPPQMPMAYGSMPQGMQAYQPPRPLNQSHPYFGPPTSSTPSSLDIDFSNPKVRFYGVLATLLVVAYFAFFYNGKSPLVAKKVDQPIRTEVYINRDIATVEKKIRDFESEQSSEQNDRMRRIKENLQRGLRDMQQGNYLRAQESFQVVMNIDSENQLAKRYFQVSKIRFDEQVKALMLQAKKYKEKYNFRLCASSYRSVENLLQNRKDENTLREAINGRRICEICQEKGSELCRDSK